LLHFGNLNVRAKLWPAGDTLGI